MVPMITTIEEELFSLLRALAIPFERFEHPPVATVEEAEPYWRDIAAGHCKNLFLRNKKGNRHYLLIVEHDKSADLLRLRRLLEEDRLSFASPERLKKYLNLEPGSVSPFALVHDRERAVRLLVDADLRCHERLTFHPNVNTATLVIAFADFEKFLAHSGHAPTYLTIPTIGT